MATRQRLRLRFVFWLTLSPWAATGCGDDSKFAENRADSKVTDDADDAGDGGASSDGDDASRADSGRFAGCTVNIAHGSDTSAIQKALLEAKTRDVICFEDGTYDLEKELSLRTGEVTLRGNARNRSAVVLDFKGQTEGDDAIKVTGDGFTIEHLTVKNTRGNSIVVDKAQRPTFRNLKVTWDGGPRTENGAYAVYPVGCTDVLVEGCEVAFASDAGIYVGQSNRAVVRNNVVHGNVAGIEIENTNDAEVYGNHTYDNTAGILVFVLPNKEQKVGERCVVHDNRVEDNNRANFGQEGTTVSFVPQGLGVLLLAADQTEIRNNVLTGNGTTGVLVVSQATFNLICRVDGGRDCASATDGTDPDTSKTYVHDNLFAQNGAAPDALLAGMFAGVSPLEDVLWDGIEPTGQEGEDQLCLGQKPPTVRTFGDPTRLDDDATDASPYTCTLPPPFAGAVSLPQDG